MYSAHHNSCCNCSMGTHGTQTVQFADIEMGYVFSEDFSSLISYCNPKQTLKEA